MPSRGSIFSVSSQSAGLTTSVTTYTSGDVLGTELTFTIGDGLFGDTPVSILKAVLTDASAGIGAVDLFLFDTASTPAADNAANSWSDANIRKLRSIIPMTVVSTSALNKAVTWTAPNGFGEPVLLSTGSLYVVMVTRTANAVFGAVTDLELRLLVQNLR